MILKTVPIVRVSGSQQVACFIARLTCQSDLDGPHRDLEYLPNDPVACEPTSRCDSSHVSHFRVTSPNRDLENLPNGAGDTFDMS